MLVDEFNKADRPDVVASLRPCLDIERWIDEVADSRPYSDLDSLLEAARRAADPFTADELETALAHHPRIGERAAGTSIEARLSTSEQAGLGAENPAIAQALADGNRVYEERFGQVFLIRAAGRSREEILAALHARLAHTPEQEERIIGEQLREIAVLRLEGLVSK
ncbi:2-oxo-4-hydroxy-4-carboxy-5-ureidoimidazoline decarboxylase [Arthrobacter sp. V4I6]|uniref:2-oxo-4-hydroxy-4-carboxy-5-ureidoimidazoline decarboxylase n=1 Tax=unclassified Arthrobacter TaxID=235627 RepID=UPI002788703C|nr:MULTISPECIES: 2-oxo-4-hydroxy-4-carboxy-5-ureidoimidazoline decarboxylase [unclassified Arthrobacter]MDQ0821292.1 2-oxo-4-hydroxy-4-carboxy-5-ureidoimidazoline decarboxylase [Arthrobacter sp. V1I7]MDQ0855556.1 2-oxo-4-hydroxy-4-carboxy-5-ureidoimidazoline decarboxylase [Arthrobacter sp. V4I6]